MCSNLSYTPPWLCLSTSPNHLPSDKGKCTRHSFSNYFKEATGSLSPAELFVLSELCAAAAGLLNMSIKGPVYGLAGGAGGIFGEYLERVS
jgi:hypothetical protein